MVPQNKFEILSSRVMQYRVEKREQEEYKGTSRVMLSKF